MSEPKREAIGQPLSQSFIARASQGVKYIVAGVVPQAWFGPAQPLKPVAQADTQDGGARGRMWDFGNAININTTPKADNNEGTSFSQLRAFADAYDLMRLVIETRKDQLSKLEFNVRKKGDISKTESPDCKMIKDFLAMPDGENTFSQWLRQLTEEMLVVDAACVYPRMTNGGDVYSLDLMDGTTIKRVIDAAGRTPIAPSPAYQQILKGMPAVDYTKDELVYFPRNKRVSRMYGYSPVEQVIVTVNIAIRRQMHQLSYYTDGSTPDLIFGVPKEWTPEQIKQFKLWWDSLLAGNVEGRRGTMFVPDGVSPINTKEDALKDAYDEWLARIICYAFSIPPTAFVKETNRATADTALKQALSEGLAPVMQWVKELMDTIIIKHFKRPDLEFVWSDEEAIEPRTRAEIDKIYVDAKVLHPDEVRDMRFHLPALTDEQKASMTPIVQTFPASTDGGQPPPDDEGAYAKKPQAPTTTKGAQGAKFKPINRNRKTVKDATAGINLAVRDFLDAERKEAKRVALKAFNDLAEKVQKDDKGGRDTLEIINAGMSDKAAKTFAVDVQGLLSGMYTDGGKEGLKQVGTKGKGALDLVNDGAIDYAQKRGAELVGMKWVDDELVSNPNAKWAITERQREVTAKLTEQALDDGWTAKELAAAIDDAAAFGEDRALMIARTETAFADVAGNMNAYRESGVVTGKKWLLGPDSCAECEANAEVGEIGLDDIFPDGSEAAPAHPNCTCDIEPVLSND